MKKIVIVGGGFAGVELIKSLTGNNNFEIVLVDKNNYTFFPPLLYQVATAFIELSNISYPFRRLFQNRKNVRFFMGEYVKVIPETNTLVTSNGNLIYDYLILAMGTETNYFGNKNVQQNAMPMKNIDDALNLRNHLLLQAEKAIHSKIREDKEKLSNFVIAGGGATGVEIAGMIANMPKEVLAKEYPEANSHAASIYLIDGAPNLLSPMSKKSQDEAFKTLNNLGVKIILNTLVKDFVDDKVVLSNGEIIPSTTLIWASGVIAREANGLPTESIGKGRRILVDEINKVRGTENIFAVGDQCLQSTDKNYLNGHPQVAQVAIQQAILLARNLKAIAGGKAIKSFQYKDKGSMAIIAKYKAVVDLPHLFIKGFFAWLAWLFIHIIPIAGYRNKAKLAFNWFLSFITDNPTLRLIVRPKREME